MSRFNLTAWTSHPDRIPMNKAHDDSSNVLGLFYDVIIDISSVDGGVDGLPSAGRGVALPVGGGSWQQLKGSW